jgi:MFS family permease
MANEQTLVAFLLGAFGFGLISAAAVLAVTHGFRNQKAIAGAIFGAVFLAASFFWPHLASALDARLVTAIGAVASNFWVWLIVLFSLWLYMAVVSLMSLHQRNQYGEIIRRDLNPFRLVLQKLVIPRSLTAGQIETIGSYLSNFSPHHVTLRVNKHDKEVMYYSGFIQKALQRDGWRIAAIEYSPDLNEFKWTCHLDAMSFTVCHTWR